MNSLPAWQIVLLIIAFLEQLFLYILLIVLIVSTIRKNNTIVKYLKPKLPAEQPETEEQHETEEQKEDREATKTAIIFFVCMIASIALITFLAAYNNGCM